MIFTLLTMKFHNRHHDQGRRSLRGRGGDPPCFQWISSILPSKMRFSRSISRFRPPVFQSLRCRPPCFSELPTALMTICIFFTAQRMFTWKRCSLYHLGFWIFFIIYFMIPKYEIWGKMEYQTETFRCSINNIKDKKGYFDFVSRVFKYFL